MKTLLFVCSLLLCLGITGCRQNEKELKITAYVNPFIGTDGHGHCFPGAILPFGGIQLSPDNPRNGWDWTSGYHYSDSIISSFSHTHLSGTGIGDLQDIRFLPVSTTPDTSISPAAYIQSGYARFSHRNEQAEPGYYSVVFDNGIKTELSTTIPMARINPSKVSMFREKPKISMKPKVPNIRSTSWYRTS